MPGVSTVSFYHHYFLFSNIFSAVPLVTTSWIVQHQELRARGLQAQAWTSLITMPPTVPRKGGPCGLPGQQAYGSGELRNMPVAPGT